MFSEYRARCLQLGGRGLHALVAERRLGVGNGLPTVLPVHCACGHRHGDQERNCNQAGCEAQQQEDRAQQLSPGGKQRHQPGPGHSEPPIGIAEPGHRVVESLPFGGARHPEDRNQVQPQCQWSKTAQRL